MNLVPMGVVNAAPNAVAITVMPVTTAPEAFTMDVQLTTPPAGGLESFRLVLDIPADLTIVGVTKTGTAMDGGLIQHSVSGNQLTVAGAIATPINTANAVIVKLQLEILQITDDIEYTISGVGRVNEVDLLPGAVTSGIARIEMVDLTGTLTSWDGKDVAGAHVTLTGATTSLDTTTDASGTYALRVGKVENQTESFVWGEPIETDTYISEQDASEALKTAVGTSSCPTQAGDITGNGEVTEQDAANFLQIALDPASYTPQVTFVPNDVSLPNFRTDRVQDSTSYILGDCSGNYSWLSGVTGGMVMSIAAPTATVEGDTITLNFPDAESTKFYLDGLPEDSKLEVAIYDLARSAEVNAMAATRGNIVVVAAAEAGFIVEVKVMSSNQQPVVLSLRGRTNESAYTEWGVVNVTPSQRLEYVFLPAMMR
ncbi:carboxypeptidase regulatory-like domain-containing protein [Candidatus Roizmanbacteria bacterium]|nr:MAG: carboxypeptidase regulatory-like domain-containing protein [Candidatus Roizmanbacteria bacterium]